MSEKNAFEFITRLPDSDMTGEVQKSPGVLFQGTYCGGHALVNCLYGDKVDGRTYTIGIGGRGSVVMDEQNFRDLLSSMLAMFEVMQPGFCAPKPTSPSLAGLPTLPGFLSNDPEAQ